MEISRVSTNNIKHLDVWDCVLSDKTLWDVMYADQFESSLIEIINSLMAGNAVSRSMGKIEIPKLDIDAIYFSGGGVPNTDINKIQCEFSIPIFVSDNPIFAGEPGGTHILERNNLCGFVIDVGQSQIKVSGKAYKKYKRNYDLLPIDTPAEEKNNDKYRSCFAEYITDSVSDYLNMSEPDSALNYNGIVVALPCDIGEKNMLGSCSYPGMGEDISFLNIIFNTLEANAQVFVLNDAELAAYSALCDLRLKNSKNILVLTLGFGVGAAVINRQL